MIYEWITLGGQTLQQCCQSDVVAYIVAAECLGILLGYLRIAVDWHQQEKKCLDVHGRESFTRLRYMFILCGLCGYGFMIIKLLVPLWLPYILLMGYLNLVTWQYALATGNFQYVYLNSTAINQIDDILAKSEISSELQVQLIKRVIEKTVRAPDRVESHADDLAS